MDTLPSLPYPVTFVCRYPENWPELFADEAVNIDPNRCYSRFSSNEECWIVLPYLYLKQSQLNVKISDRFIPGEICVASSIDFGIRELTFRSFVVGCRSDGPSPALCDFAIVQNEANLESEAAYYMPHWPQPGLVPRAAERGTHIETITYKGDRNNLYESFQSAEFLQALEELGVQLQISDKSQQGTVQWHDYRGDDLVLAVRDLTEKDALVKPASKLVNAWIAGVPALLGPEPAFRDLRRSHLDYIEVTTPEAALEAVRQLKSQPDLYQAMITNGQQRAQDYTVDRLVQRWHEVLSGPVAAHYAQWKQRPMINRFLEFSRRSIRQKIALRSAAYDRVHGYRTISGQQT